jgi:hypothetical protein
MVSSKAKKARNGESHMEFSIKFIKISIFLKNLSYLIKKYLTKYPVSGNDSSYKWKK